MRAGIILLHPQDIRLQMLQDLISFCNIVAAKVLSHQFGGALVYLILLVNISS